MEPPEGSATEIDSYAVKMTIKDIKLEEGKQPD